MKKKTSDQCCDQCCGMDSLDCFAAHALTGILANPNKSIDAAVNARNAYTYAEEMLKEKERLAELRKNKESLN